MKNLNSKLALIIFIVLLIIFSSLHYFMPIQIAFAIPDKPSWGKLYTSSDNKHICACDEVDECTPCLTIPD